MGISWTVTHKTMASARLLSMVTRTGMRRIDRTSARTIGVMTIQSSSKTWRKVMAKWGLAATPVPTRTPASA